MINNTPNIIPIKNLDIAMVYGGTRIPVKRMLYTCVGSFIFSSAMIIWNIIMIKIQSKNAEIKKLSLENKELVESGKDLSAKLECHKNELMRHNITAVCSEPKKEFHRE